MAKITTFLTFNDQAEAAVALYTSLFPDGKILETSRYGEGAPFPAGTVMTQSWQMCGLQYTALNAGPSFTFSQGISLAVSVETQAEVDRLWDKLTADGGKPVMCGWLTDKFGVSWQIVPVQLPRLLASKDKAVAGRVMAAMMKMQKLDIAALEAAAQG